MIYKFRPIFKSTIWGGDEIARFKGITLQEDNIGESWEISGVKGNLSVVDGGTADGLNLRQLIENDGAGLLGKANYERFGLEFPLLIKFIDARQDLSIQVHPDDKLAMERHGSKGKTEMWYVVNATPTAHLKSGLNTDLTPETYVQAVENNTICDKLEDYNVKAGDVFFLPAGRIHSIGAGCFIAEIQQTSDITYRIYDFNRLDANGNPRQLHTELAKDAIDYTVSDNYRTDYTMPREGMVTLVDCPYFNVDMAAVGNDALKLPETDSFFILMAIENDIEIKADGCTDVLRKGHTALISADTESTAIKALANEAKVLIAYIG